MSDKITIEKIRFFYLRKHISEDGLVVRCEACDNDTDRCYSVMQCFYNEQHHLIREIEDVDNNVLTPNPSGHTLTIGGFTRASRIMSSLL